MHFDIIEFLAIIQTQLERIIYTQRIPTQLSYFYQIFDKKQIRNTVPYNTIHNLKQKYMKVHLLLQNSEIKDNSLFLIRNQYSVQKNGTADRHIESKVDHHKLDWHKIDSQLFIQAKLEILITKPIIPKELTSKYLFFSYYFSKYHFRVT